MPRDYFGEIEEEQCYDFVPKPPRLSNYEGERYGEWLVVKRINPTDYICRCSCGFEAKRKIYSIQKKSTRCFKCSKRRNIDIKNNYLFNQETR